jgi:cell division septal protein FtsQ
MIQRKIIFLAILIKIFLISIFGLFWYISKEKLDFQVENYKIKGEDPST